MSALMGSSLSRHAGAPQFDGDTWTSAYMMMMKLAFAGPQQSLADLWADMHKSGQP
jgi:hypothetical protein